MSIERDDLGSDIELCPYCGGELYDGDITLHVGRPYGPCPESQEEVLDVE